MLESGFCPRNEPIHSPATSRIEAVCGSCRFATYIRRVVYFVGSPGNEELR